MSLYAPDGWTEVSVDDLKAASDFALATGPFGSSIGSRFFQEDGVPVIRGNNLSDDGQTYLIDSGFVFLSREKAAEFRRSVVCKGDLVFTCWGTIHQIGLISDRAQYPQYIISNKQMKFTPDPRKADSLFLFYLFSGPEFQRQIGIQSIGTSVPGFNLGRLRAIRFSVPGPAEQRAIAKALSDVDALLGGLDRLIAKKRDLKQAAMQQLLTGQTRLAGFGGTKRHRQFDYGSIPDDWDVKPFSKVSSMNGRIGWQGLKQEEFTERPDDPFLITGMNFKDGRIRWEEVYHIPAKRYHEAPDIQLWAGDVLMTKDGTIGKLLFVDYIPYPGKASLNSHLLVFRPFEKHYDSKFLFYQLGSPRFARHIDLNKSGSTFFGLTQAATGKYPLVLPSLAEQTAIADVLSDMDADLAALMARRDKTRDLKLAMMQELLTGKTRLVPVETDHA